MSYGPHGSVRFVNDGNPQDGSINTDVILVAHNGNALYVKSGGTWALRSLPLVTNNTPAIKARITDCYINGVAHQEMPENELHWAYVADVSGDLVIDFSKTPHCPDQETGVEIKAQDPTRTLVGMVYPLYGSIAPTANNMLLGTYFHRYSTGLFTDPTGSTTAGWYEHNSDNRINMVCWADEAPSIQGNFVVSSSVGLQSNYAGVGVNQATNADGYGRFKSAPNTQSPYQDIQTLSPIVPFAAFSEGFHWLSCLLKSGWSGNTTAFEDGSRLTCWWRG